MSSNELIRVSGLAKSYDGHTILRGVDLSVQRGEKVCIVGPSGSGKTTLLRCLNVLIEPDAGELYFEDEIRFKWDGRSYRPRVLQEHRRDLGMVFQQFELFPHLTVLHNVTLGPREHRTPRAIAETHALELLERVGMGAHARKHPLQLSGGQQQRVAIARALAMTPSAILFDEPTSALDPEMAHEVVDIMRQLALAGTTMIVVTHDMGLVSEIADRVVVMDDGAIIEEGDAEKILTRPNLQRTTEILRVNVRG